MVSVCLGLYRKGNSVNKNVFEKKKLDMKRKAFSLEQKGNNKIILLDFDETIGSYGDLIAQLAALGDLISRDPELRKVPVKAKRLLRQFVKDASLAQARPGTLDYLRLLYRLKQAHFVKNIIVITAATGPSSSSHWGKIGTSPQQIILESLLHQAFLPLDLISEYKFTNQGPKDVASLESPTSDSDEFWVVDDYPLLRNYQKPLDTRIKGHQRLYPFRLEPQLGTELWKDVEATWKRNPEAKRVKDKKIREIRKLLLDRIKSSRSHYERGLELDGQDISLVDSPKTWDTETLLSFLGTSECNDDSQCPSGRKCDPVLDLCLS